MRHYFDSVVNSATGRPLVGAQVRVLDSNGDLASIYSDENGTPATNPLTVNGADTSSPGLFQFYADDGIYTLEYVYGGGTILTIPDVDISADLTNAQAAASDGSSLVGFLQSGTDAVARTVEEKLQETVSVLDFDADPTGATASTAAIQAAIDTGKNVFFPDGVYKFVGLEASTDYQCIICSGNASLEKSGNGTMIELSGVGCRLEGAQIDGGRVGGVGPTGDNVLLSGAECKMVNSTSIHAAGRAVKITAGACELWGGIRQTDDASGYSTEVTNGAEYVKIFGEKGGDTLADGGVLIDNANADLSCVQIGKLTFQNGGGGKVTQSRMTGPTVVHSSNVMLDANTYSDNVTFGNGTNSYSNCAFGPCNFMQSGTTFTLSNGMQEGSFHLGQLQRGGGVTISINATAAGKNELFHSRISYSPTLGAGNGSPTIGNATVSAGYSCNGADRLIDLNLTVGTTTNFGGGAAIYLTAPFTANQSMVGIGIAQDATGSPAVIFAQIVTGTNQIYLKDKDGAAMTNAAPFTWAQNDTIALTIAFRHST